MNEGKKVEKVLIKLVTEKDRIRLVNPEDVKIDTYVYFDDKERREKRVKIEKQLPVALTFLKEDEGYSYNYKQRLYKFERRNVVFKTKRYTSIFYENEILDTSDKEGKLMKCIFRIFGY